MYAHLSTSEPHWAASSLRSSSESCSGVCAHDATGTEHEYSYRYIDAGGHGVPVYVVAGEQRHRLLLCVHA